MDRDEAMELLSAALDGELDLAQQALLDEYLAQCPDCRALQTELLGMEEALGALEVPAPAELKERILAGLPPQRSKGGAVHWRRWCAMAACAALVVLGLWQLRRGTLDAAGEPGGDAVTAAAHTAEEADADAFSYNGDAQDEPKQKAALFERERVSDAAGAGGAGSSDVRPEDTPAPAALFTADAQESATEDAPSKEEEVQAVSPAAPIATPFALPRESSPVMPVPEPEQPAEDNAATAADEDGAAPQDLNVAADGPMEAADAQDGMVDAISDSYCGVLTLDQYEPGGQEYLAEAGENGAWLYLLPAQHFHALVDRLDSEGLAYQLDAEGGNVSPDAPYGLVVVTGQGPSVQAP